MSSLLNKLTGHHTDKTHSTTDNTHNHTTTTTTGGVNTAAPLNNSQYSTTTQQTTTTGTNPYGASGTINSGAAYTNTATATGTGTGSNMANTHTATTGYSHQGTTMRDDAITRSEEQLHVAKERVNTGKAELNKYVTTEHVEQAVPVTKERVVIEREPITEANRSKAMSGPAISEAHYETNLTEDRVSASKETVPIERIRLAKQVETTVENVGADLRKEHVDFTHSKLSNDFNNVNNVNNNNMTTNAGVPHTKLNNNY